MVRLTPDVSGVGRDRWLYTQLWRIQTDCSPIEGGETIEKEEKETKAEPYRRADYLGQKTQIDVKYVLSYCIADGK